MNNLYQFLVTKQFKLEKSKENLTHPSKCVMTLVTKIGHHLFWHIKGKCPFIVFVSLFVWGFFTLFHLCTFFIAAKCLCVLLYILQVCSVLHLKISGTINYFLHSRYSTWHSADQLLTGWNCSFKTFLSSSCFFSVHFYNCSLCAVKVSRIVCRRLALTMGCKNFFLLLLVVTCCW